MNHLYTPFSSRHLQRTVEDRASVTKAVWTGFYRALLLCLCLLLFSAIEAEATHFRYGNINWRVVSGTTVEFKVAMVYRSGYFGNPSVGSTIYSEVFLEYGDGSSSPIYLTVTSRSNSEDWFYGEATFTKTYADPNGVYNVYFQSCCRLSTLQNNSDQNYRVETVVNLGSGNSSPVSTLPPIINLPQGVAAATFTIPASDPNGNTLAFSLTPNSQMGGSSYNPSGFSIDAATGIASFNTTGTTIGHLYNASVTIDDGTGARIAVDFLIKIATASNPPVFVSPSPVSGTVFNIDAGQTLNFTMKAQDPDAADVVTMQVVGLPPTASLTPELPVSGAVGGPVETAFSWTPALASVGTHIVNFTAEDNNGAQATSSVTIVVHEQACAISLDGSSSNVSCVGGADGSITLTATGGTAPFEYSIDNGASYHSSNVFTGVAADTYLAVVRDAEGCSAETTVEVMQHNDLPVINSLSGGPADPLSIAAASVSMSAEVTDDNLSSAVWNWGDDTESAISSPGATISGSHTYGAAGVYPITLTITDACGETDTKVFEYVVVYDPSAGFVTGGGWIHSPAGAYPDAPLAEGKANFGFVSKYKKGATVPDGQTQFQFHAVSFNFHSTLYEWLVVSGFKAQYKGEGTVNGEAGYGFMLSAIDGAKKSSTEPDRFRIKVWEIATDRVVYDNQLGDDDLAEASLALGSGSIVIHDGGKKASAREAAPEVLTLSGFAAYPNPLVADRLWLELPAMEQRGEVKACIYDLSGKVLAENTFVVEKEGSKVLWTLEYNHWSKGLYLLVIKSDSYSQQVKLIK